jgi:hypothetical protein
MSRLVTFYGNAVDALGYPIPYHRFFIVEGPAPWVGPNALSATIQVITAAPLPNPPHVTVNNGAAGQAITAAVAALQALAGNQGLNVI